MDIIPYLLDVLLTAVAAYWFVANIRRQPGSPTTGLFRYHETLEQPVLKLSQAERSARYRPRPAAATDTAQAKRPQPGGRASRARG